jgi:LysR family glycine cleavage system transcriptional activator
MSDLPPLNALKAFEASGRHLNFRHAANELGVTQGAVAQQVRALEAHLGLKLFTRHARGLALPSEGRRYLPAISRSFAMIAEATANLAPAATIATISTTPSFATRWLVPRLGDFSRQHPGIRVRLDASNTLANFQNDGVDLAIRQGSPPFGPGLAANLLCGSNVIAVCHPDMTSGAEAIRSPMDLKRHVLLEDTHGMWPVFLEAALGGSRPFDVTVMNFSQTSLAIDAAMSRQGVALTNRILVEDDLKARRLCQPFDFSIDTGDGFYAVAPRKPRNPDLVARIRTWLTSQILQEDPG